MQKSQIRSIKKVIIGQNAVDGAGVKLVREIGYHDTKEFDPFLMLDAFDSTNPSDYVKGFPWHPHRGIETITYLIDGTIEHGDSMGNSGVIGPGDCQWMTAGSGIIHQEMPIASKRMLGAQLWLNLPAKDKMTKPAYRPIVKNDIPVVDVDSGKVHIICGAWNGVNGAIDGDYVKALYLDVELDRNAVFEFETDPGSTLFVYIIEGNAVFGDTQSVAEKHVILFNQGSVFRAATTSGNVRFLLMSGKPLREPIAWGGPIVMNTQEELNQAFLELDNNSFIKE
jgi:redox-sensitive bicupin YhaK (pirin superfamily)